MACSGNIYPNPFFELAETLLERMDIEMALATGRALGMYYLNVRFMAKQRRLTENVALTSVAFGRCVFARGLCRRSACRIKRCGASATTST